jgi:hypothetical protein
MDGQRAGVGRDWGRKFPIQSRMIEDENENEDAEESKTGHDHQKLQTLPAGLSTSI